MSKGTKDYRGYEYKYTAQSCGQTKKRTGRNTQRGEGMIGKVHVQSWIDDEVLATIGEHLSQNSIRVTSMSNLVEKALEELVKMIIDKGGIAVVEQDAIQEVFDQIALNKGRRRSSRFEQNITQRGDNFKPKDTRKEKHKYAQAIMDASEEQAIQRAIMRTPEWKEFDKKRTAVQKELELTDKFEGLEESEAKRGSDEESEGRFDPQAMREVRVLDDEKEDSIFEE